MKNKQQKGFRVRSPKLIAAILGILVVAAIIFITFAHRPQPKAVSGTIKTVESSTTSNPSPTTNTSDDTNGSNSEQTNTDKSSVGSQNSSNIKLVAPYGSFVSNHQPGQNGSDLKELSQCITSSGATCYIKFTQGNVVKTLPEKTADQSGSILWEWNISDAGLTSGKWRIEAVATLDSQTESTADQLNLEVK